jgi:hypothetical protein
MARRANDFYPTPAWATQELLRHVNIRGSLFECCVGKGDIANVLRSEIGPMVVTNDIDKAHHADVHFDASQDKLWQLRPDWTITNPPFSCAIDIVKRAHAASRVGVAMLLRLSFLEPTEDRGAWLNDNPPQKIIVLPRISFTGDGKTDSVTCAWMVWQNQIGLDRQSIIIAKNPKFN